MLIQYLQGAIQDLQTLISYTKLDIEAIKQAEHNEIFERNIQKDMLIKEFETKKSLIDQEIRVIKEKQPHKDIQEILDQEVIDLFGDMRNILSELKQVNSDYAHVWCLPFQSFLLRLWTDLFQRILQPIMKTKKYPAPHKQTFCK